MNSFIPQLIDLICLTVDRNYAGPGQGITSPTRESNSSDSDDEVPDMSHLNQFAIVMDFVDADLDKVFKHNIAFNEHHMLKVIYSSLCSLAFIHDTNIMHRDIKSANILIPADCNAKICDFGLSRSLPESSMFLENLNSQRVRQFANETMEPAQ